MARYSEVPRVKRKPRDGEITVKPLFTRTQSGVTYYENACEVFIGKAEATNDMLREQPFGGRFVPSNLGVHRK